MAAQPLPPKPKAPSGVGAADHDALWYCYTKFFEGGLTYEAAAKLRGFSKPRLQSFCTRFDLPTPHIEKSKHTGRRYGVRSSGSPASKTDGVRGRRMT